MLVPNGVKPGDYDTVFAGATSARFSALTGGAVDAAILLPPFNFYAEAAGFNSLGLTVDYAKELPFAGGVVGRAWAASHKASLDKILKVHSRSMAWFADLKNRDEAIKIMIEASKLKEDVVAKSYDFLRDKEIFEIEGKISRTKMSALLKVLKELGDVEGSVEVERFVLTGATQLSD
jgi:NitT/TauT family transport system substrate-binding protein